VTPSPHHPIGAKGVGESPNVGGVSAFSNAVVDAFAHLGVTHQPMPDTAARLWRVCHDHGLTGPAIAAA
jgi:carbon-monoxide dehydrogenase large subunit